MSASFNEVAMDAQGTVIALSIFAVVAGVLFFLFMAAVVPNLIFRYMRGPLEQRIAARYRPEDVLLQDLRANSLGQESTGRFQIRGNGGLVLTGKSLHFFLFIPRSDVAIPLDAITDVTITQSHLGKKTFYPLLRVAFLSSGGPDSIAWYVTDLHTWKSRLDALTAARATGETPRDTTT